MATAVAAYEREGDAKAMPLKIMGMDASASLCEHLQRQGLRNRLFSDIVLSFQGKDYALHRIVLSQSSYFLSLLSGPWKEHGKPRVELKIDDVNVTPKGLEMAFDYLYGLNPPLTTATVESVLAAACFLCLEKLGEGCVQFMVENLGVDTFLDYHQLLEQHSYGQVTDRIRNACWSFLCAHASRELVDVLPKLSLPTLCRLLQSEELWVPSELERWKLAKQTLIDWVIAHMKPVVFDTHCSCSRRLAGKLISARKQTRSVTAQNSLKGKAPQKSGRCNNKDSGPMKETPGGELQEEAFSVLREDANEPTLKRLQSLWESAAADQTEVHMEDFHLVAKLFAEGGIVFARMESEEVLQVRQELEDAKFSTAAADESIRQHALLKSRMLNLGEPRNNACNESSDDDEEETEADDEDDDDDEYEDEVYEEYDDYEDDDDEHENDDNRGEEENNNDDDDDDDDDDEYEDHYHEEENDDDDDDDDDDEDEVDEEDETH